MFERFPPLRTEKPFLCGLKNRNRILFVLQETYSTAEVEDIWRTQWQGKLFFSHGTCHSCGVMVLVRGDLDFNLISIRTDDEGRYIVLEAEVQEANFLLVNVYVPNKVQEQCRFIENLNSTIDDVLKIMNLSLLWVGTLMLRLSQIVTARVEIQLKGLQLKVFRICVLILIWSTSGEFGILPLDVLRGGKETHLFKEG